MSKKFYIEATEDEVNQIAYALKELGSRRMSEAIDFQQKWREAEGESHFLLASRVYKVLNSEPVDPSLIAAAPELLEALQHVLIASEDGGDMNDISWTMLRSAIAKATGSPV